MIPIRNRYPDFTPEMALKWHRAGLSHREIAEKVGCGRTTVQNRLRDGGVTPVAKTQTRPDISTEDILAMRSEGATVAHIAEIFACTPAAIYFRLQKAEHSPGLTYCSFSDKKVVEAFIHGIRIL